MFAVRATPQERMATSWCAREGNCAATEGECRDTHESAPSANVKGCVLCEHCNTERSIRGISLFFQFIHTDIGRLMQAGSAHWSPLSKLFESTWSIWSSI